MERTGEQKLDEVSDVSQAHAGADPGAVVVVNSHANVAVVAVKRPWGSQNLTSVAEAELVVFVVPNNLRADSAGVIVMPNDLHDRELLQRIEFAGITPSFRKGSLELLLIQVAHEVL